MKLNWIPIKLLIIQYKFVNNNNSNWITSEHVHIQINWKHWIGLIIGKSTNHFTKSHFFRPLKIPELICSYFGKRVHYYLIISLCSSLFNLSLNLALYHKKISLVAAYLCHQPSLFILSVYLSHIFELVTPPL